MDHPAAVAKSMTRATAWRVLRLVYVVAVSVLLGLALLQAGPQWMSSSTHPPWWGMAAFVGSWIAMAAILGIAWAWILRACTGHVLSLREWLPIQAAAWAGRYLPGKIGVLAGKLSLLQNTGIGWKPLGFTVLFEQLAFVVAGFAIVLALPLPLAQLGMPFAEGWEGAHALRVAVSLLALAIFPWLMAAVARRANTVCGASGYALLVLQAPYLAAHAVVGIGFYAIVSSTGVLNGPSVAYAVGLLAAANVAGILAVFAPAGIGVRELVLAAGLTPYMPFDESLALAVVLRLLSIMADTVFCAVAGSLALRQRQPQPRP